MSTTNNAEAPPAGPLDGRVLLPAWFQPNLYDLTLHPTVTDVSNKFRFEGAVDVVANVAEDGHDRVTLHAKELAVLDAKWIPDAAPGDAQDATSISVDAHATTVSFAFKSPLPKGSGKLRINFIGTHNDQMAGFYRSGYNDVSGTRRMMVSTQFEALDARRCFPCVDEPAAKAVFKATLVVDDHLTALSNMPESEITLLPNKKKRVSFLPSPKMSTYLLAFAVGEFDFVQARTQHGVMVRVFTPPGKASLGTFALDVATKSLDLYDDYFDVPYPLPKLDMIAIPEFAMGAMENWGLVTYREVEVLVAPDASADQKQRVTTVITHELAHQWFGNLVTMAWWRGLWLNEGFASWMQTFAADKIFPDWSMWAQFVVDDQATAMSLDALQSSHPIDVLIKNAEEVEEVFDAISYHKGACAVQLAHAYLGPDAFRDGLRNYFKRHGYGNTETLDLWRAWEEVSGKPVGAVMSSWTDQLGFPMLRVSKIRPDNGAIKFKVKQKWFLADGSSPPGSDTKSWKIPLLATYGTGSGPDDVTADGVEAGFLDSLQEVEFSVPAQGVTPSSTGVWLKLNSGQHVMTRVVYDDPEDVDKLARAVRRRDMSHPMDRAGLLLDAYALAKAGITDPGQLLVLLSAYEEEDNMAVWDAVEQSLNGLAAIVRGTELEPQLAAFARKLVQRRAEALGWEAKPTDTHLDTLSRAILVRLQAKFMSNDDAVKARARALFDAYVADPLKSGIPSDIKMPVFRVALANGSSKDLDDFLATLKKLETVAQMKDVYLSAGFTPKAEDKLRVMDWSTSGAIRLQDFFYPHASVAGSSAAGGEIAFKYMQDHFARIHGMVKSASPSLIMAVISYCSSGFASAQRADEIEAFFKANPVPLAARKVSQIVENTRANAAFLARAQQSAKFKEVLSGKWKDALTA